MPDHLIEQAADEYLEIQQIRKNDVPFYLFFRNWLHREGYTRYIKHL